MTGNRIPPRPARRRLVGLALGTLLPLPGWSQDRYPTRPVRVIVPFAAGGTIDWIARTVSTHLGQRLGQQVYIENKPGANGLIGTEVVANAPGDGYTLLLVTGSFAVNPGIYRNLKYDVIRDFTPITAYAKATGMLVLVNAEVAARDVKELVDLSRRDGSDLNYGSPGIGNTIHLATELFKQRTGARITHIPYKGSAPAVNALLGNEVQVMIVPPPLALPFVKSGKLRAVAFTGSSRLPDLPEVPTLDEAGVSGDGLEGSWIGLFAPSGTPVPVIERIYAELRSILGDRGMRESFGVHAPGYVADGRSPVAFSAQVKSDVARYADVIRRAGIQPQ